ncbi:MAG: hypothetical protein WBV46_17395 [Terriglobales bacterium]
MFKEGQTVLAQGYGATPFRITKLMRDGQFATIEAFNLSAQKLKGSPVANVPVRKLVPFKEDASQAAARIVREATEDR